MVLVLGVLVVINLYVFVWDKKTSVRAIAEQAHHAQPTMSVPSAPLFPASPTPPTGATPAGGSTSTQTAPLTVVEGKVATNDTLGRLLKHHGLSAGEADEVIRSLSGVLDFKTIKTGEPFKITRGKDGRVQRFELALAKGHNVHTERQTTGELLAKSE
ncbi:hypothetical protein BH11MYX1_BH11MYX1_26120 [soil metagenome]